MVQTAAVTAPTSETNWPIVGNVRATAATSAFGYPFNNQICPFSAIRADPPVTTIPTTTNASIPTTHAKTATIPALTIIYATIQNLSTRSFGLPAI